MWRSETEMLAEVKARAGRRHRRRRLQAGLAAVAVATVAAVVAVTVTGGGPHSTSVDVGGNVTPSTASSAPVTHPTAASCKAPVSLPAGVAIPAANLGAISFVSPEVGVALSASAIFCYVPEGREMGAESYERAQPERLATTTDGGTTWTTRGAALAAATATKLPLLEAVVATSTAALWAVTAAGTLTRTTDQGRTWVTQPVATPVVDMARVGDWLWALSCLPAGAETCQYALQRAPIDGGTWQPVRVPSLGSDPLPQLVVASPDVVLLLISRYPDSPGKILITTDGGTSWRLQPTPKGPRGFCGGDAGLAATGPDDWWAICTAGASAHQTTKALLHTVDGGRRWTTIASVSNLAAAPPLASITYGDVTALVAGSPTLLWLAWDNGLQVSTDSGVTWPANAAVSPQGASGSFDVYDHRTAWFLVPGIGLWATTDGTTWDARGTASSP